MHGYRVGKSKTSFRLPQVALPTLRSRRVAIRGASLRSAIEEMSDEGKGGRVRKWRRRSLNNDGDATTTVWGMGEEIEMVDGVVTLG